MKADDLVEVHMRTMPDYATKRYGAWGLLCFGLLIDHITDTYFDGDTVHILTTTGVIRQVNLMKNKEKLQFKVGVISESG